MTALLLLSMRGRLSIPSSTSFCAKEKQLISKLNENNSDFIDVDLEKLTKEMLCQNSTVWP